MEKATSTAELRHGDEKKQARIAGEEADRMPRA
jgi:hypothetical protein